MRAAESKNETPSPSHNTTWLTIAQVAAILSIAYNTVLNEIKAGKLPALRVGKAYRILRKDLDNYIAGNMAVRG